MYQLPINKLSSANSRVHRPNSAIYKASDWLSASLAQPLGIADQASASECFAENIPIRCPDIIVLLECSVGLEKSRIMPVPII